MVVNPPVVGFGIVAAAADNIAVDFFVVEVWRKNTYLLGGFRPHTFSWFWTFGTVLVPLLYYYRGKKDKWVKEYQGQLLISTGAVQWTTDCSKALNAISGGNKTALKALKKKQVRYTA